MRIKLGESTTAPPVTQGRTSVVPQSQSVGEESTPSLVTVAVSAPVRALAAALSRLPRAGDGQSLSELLTQVDREVLVAAYRFAEQQGVDLVEVDKLLGDLSSYRQGAVALGATLLGEAQELVGEAPPAVPRPDEASSAVARLGDALRLSDEAFPATKRLDEPLKYSDKASPAAKPLAWWTAKVAPAALEVARPGVLLQEPGLPFGLHELSPEDESTARVILSSFALRDTTLDPQFVRDVLDPDRQPARVVDFAFLRRLVVALSASHSDGAIDPPVSFPDREARAVLVRVVGSVAAALARAPSLSPERLERGSQLLLQRTIGMSEPARLYSRTPVAAERMLPTFTAPGTTSANVAAPAGSSARGSTPAAEISPRSSDATPLAGTDAVTADVREAVASEASPSLASEPPATEHSLRRELTQRLSPSDRRQLSVLYAEAEVQACDLRIIDALAEALAALREAQAASASVLSPRVRPRSLYPTRSEFDPGRSGLESHASPGVAADAPEVRPRESTRPYGSPTQLAAKLAGAYGAGSSSAPLNLASPAFAAAASRVMENGAEPALLRLNLNPSLPGLISATTPRVIDPAAQTREIAARLPLIVAAPSPARRGRVRRPVRAALDDDAALPARELESPAEVGDELPRRRPRWRWLIRQRTRLHRR